MLQAICPNDGDDAILSSSDVCKVVQDKLSEVGVSSMVEKGLSEDDMSLEVGCSAEFTNSLQFFIKDNTGIAETDETSTDDDSRNQNKFVQRISGVTQRQLEVSTSISLILYPIFLYKCSFVFYRACCSSFHLLLFSC